MAGTASASLTPSALQMSKASAQEPKRSSRSFRRACSAFRPSAPNAGADLKMERGVAEAPYRIVDEGVGAADQATILAAIVGLLSLNKQTLACMLS
jgi:hypothetical protein